MKKKVSKLLILILAYSGILLVDACRGTDCNCPDFIFPFFDYQSLAIDGENMYKEGALTVFHFTAHPGEVDFLTNATPCQHFGFINSAYACSCIEDGNEGPKFSTQEINIFTNQDFDTDHPAGSSLNDVFGIRPTYYQQDTVFMTLSEAEEVQDFVSPWDVFSIETRMVPDSIGFDFPFYFTVEVIKENGDTINGTTSAVYWFE